MMELICDVGTFARAARHIGSVDYADLLDMKIGPSHRCLDNEQLSAQVAKT